MNFRFVALFIAIYHLKKRSNRVRIDLVIFKG